MKTILLFSILLFCAFAIALPLSAETEEISKIKDDIATIKTDIAVLTSEVENLKVSVNERFDSIEKNFDRQNNIIIACIGIPLAILAIGATVWGILAHRRGRKDQTFEKRIENLTEEIETLRQQRIVNS